MKINKINAFTLAEVLIVVGIIGIIAQITIPPLINNIEKQTNIAGLKKAYSVIFQIYNQVKLENGGTIENICGQNDSECLGHLFEEKMQYIEKVSGIPDTTYLENCWDSNLITNANEEHVCYILKDGMILDIDMEYTNKTGARIGFLSIDTNGRKKPNKFGKDRYNFTVLFDKIIPNPTSLGCKDGEGSWTDNLGCAHKYLLE